ncbi:putative hect e3 ubiquitin [Monocercomonoides exilis]|uniref:putative hect e3 ubiquitin n=1 Tax=Monocercomonoides exilis TaxID=2049356 RepID=UPI00355A5BC4|nr:putative hect e3 ubiquitin [Monocercomonoides exilis]|eukprot:MONOS_7611.1-p1 / transcript=MONOS_7611.1 / gene=MONOS_7611 / organism=Monocercomonoides_exilis_PA203 / gene_product=papain family cysteine protease domain containing protein / transcript_product=papain family cysteine protease domain containing protein / location=Mono_scaffold00264:68186-70342(-) / protein_length=624 / sequence_SO=supercontig / SO=protein_coding / is_pseudo=false
MEEPLLPQEKKRTFLNPCIHFTQLFLICVSIILGIILTIFASLKLNTKEKPTSFSYDLQPFKWAVDMSIPHKDQAHRGTCWAQALVGSLEHSYRENGIKRGFLVKDEYVPFSVQAFGLEIVKECQKPENMKICEEVGAGPLRNTTQGGESAWIFYLPNLYTKLYPESLCAYKPTVKEEWDCPNLNESTKGTNPVRFTVRAMDTTYSVEDTKQLLLKKKEPLLISTALPSNVFYIPCNVGAKGENDAYSKFCETTTDRVPCPYYINKVRNDDQCLKMEEEDFISPDGEWTSFSPFVSVGGHEMKIVGFNDEWVTHDGKKGGFILENSWATGSHSIAFWMQKRSAWNERMVCPNSMDFQNWFACASMDEEEGGETYENENRKTNGKDDSFERNWKLNRNTVSSIKKLQRKQLNEMRKHPHANDIANMYAKRLIHHRQHMNANNKTNTDKIDISMCLDANSMDHVIDVMRQPTEFECTDTGAEITGCDNGKKRYFFIGNTIDKNHLVNLYFASVSREDTKQVEMFSVNGIPVTQVEKLFHPIKEQSKRLANEVDNCGYNMMPYSFLDVGARRCGTWESNYLEVEWEDSSYLANKKSYPQYDYSWLEKSQTKQKEWQFEGPFPFTEPE